ncbi:MAG: glycosyltransferase family 2 protein [Saprospiraceae bacterium]|nr:glycosyltransferase family 2 protein [Pyrinomonadaceae bacterium]
MSTPVCSIIIPTYNHAKYIERSVECALRQTLENVEVIVVDDGSTDETPEIVTQFADKIIYHRKENGGLGAARNTGIGISRGKYIQFLDADDTIDDTKLEKQVRVFEKDDSVSVVYSDCSCSDADGADLENASYPLGDGEDPIPVLLHRTLSGVHASLVKRSAVIEAGMFDESRVAQEDWDLWLRIALKGQKYKYLPGNLAHYDQQGSAMVTNPVLMYRRTLHLLSRFLDNPDLRGLGQNSVNDFIAYQNFALATRSYNNGWWRRSRGHFLKALRANPKLVEREYWLCVPKTILHQIADAVTGKHAVEPDDLAD